MNSISIATFFLSCILFTGCRATINVGAALVSTNDDGNFKDVVIKHPLDDKYGDEYSKKVWEINGKYYRVFVKHASRSENPAPNNPTNSYQQPTTTKRADSENIDSSNLDKESTTENTGTQNKRARSSYASPYQQTNTPYDATKKKREQPSRYQSNLDKESTAENTGTQNKRARSSYASPYQQTNTQYDATKKKREQPSRYQSNLDKESTAENTGTQNKRARTSYVASLYQQTNTQYDAPKKTREQPSRYQNKEDNLRGSKYDISSYYPKNKIENNNEEKNTRTSTLTTGKVPKPNYGRYVGQNSILVKNLVETINQKRKCHNLEPIVYDNQIAKALQKTVAKTSKCPSIQKIGSTYNQNFAKYTKYNTLNEYRENKGTASIWYSEGSSWDYERNTCKEQANECMHFVNMMNPSAKSMGCAFFKCGPYILCNFEGGNQSPQIPIGKCTN